VSEAAITIKEITKTFGAKVAVNKVTFTVGVGECYGLIGPNGAGKTTTFSMMCGYLFPDSGQITVLGADPWTPGALKGKVGVLPQDAVLPPQVRVGELLTYWAKLSALPNPEKEAKEALEKVGLPETWKVFAGALSHGMAKRVAMAQALMGSPPVILLDEPTAGLDPKISHQIRALIREMKGKQTIVVSSHNLQELEELCDATALIDRGNLVAAATMAEMTSQAAEFRVLIAKGTPPLEELSIARGVKSATLDAQNMLVVIFDSKVAPPEEIITATLKLLIERGVLVLGVHRGRKLEERVMQLT
jgi:ABC-2 type transport system ATP-binding protein